MRFRDHFLGDSLENFAKSTIVLTKVDLVRLGPIHFAEKLG
jgi:hypothetical protein